MVRNNVVINVYMKQAMMQMHVKYNTGVVYVQTCTLCPNQML